MAVRVRVKIESGGRKLETSALVNTGFETETPQLLLPEAAARKLGLSIEGAERKEYVSVGGVVRLYKSPSQVKVCVSGGPEVRAEAIISPFEEEVLISDKLIDALGIVLENVARGTWRLEGETEARESESPQRW